MEMGAGAGTSKWDCADIARLEISGDMFRESIQQKRPLGLKKRDLEGLIYRRWYFYIGPVHAFVLLLPFWRTLRLIDWLHCQCEMIRPGGKKAPSR